MGTLENSRKFLRELQGAGARWDSSSAPARELDWARRGTAYFARILNDLTDAELDKPSLAQGWSRHHVDAHVGYHARALTRLTEMAAGNPANLMYSSEAERLAEIEQGATLPSHALRGLFRHSSVHLDVEWRDLTAEAWDVPLHLSDDRPCTARDTPMMRAQEVWLRSADLDAGGSLVDMPPDMLDHLLEDAVRSWNTQPLILVVIDRGGLRLSLGSGEGHLISGRAADLLSWLSGRGAKHLSNVGSLPVAPLHGKWPAQRDVFNQKDHSNE